MPNAGHNDPKFADEPEGFMAMATDNGDDTEGHLRAFITDDGSADGPDAVKTRVTDEGEDTEGHKLHPSVTDDGTIPNAPADYRLVSATDDGDDTEGFARNG